MKKVELYTEGKFSDKGMAKLLVHDSPYFKILNFKFKAGQNCRCTPTRLKARCAWWFWKGRESFWERIMPHCRPSKGTRSSPTSLNPMDSRPKQTCGFWLPSRHPFELTGGTYCGQSENGLGSGRGIKWRKEFR